MMNDLEKKIPNEIMSIALVLAYLSNHIAEGLLNNNRAVYNETILPAPDIDAWLKFYAKNEFLSGELNKTTVSALKGDNKLLEGTSHVINEIINTIGLNLEELNFLSESRSPLKSESVDVILNAVHENELKEFEIASISESFVELLNRPPIIFFFQIVIPCWILYGKSARELFKEACEGNISSFTKLIKIDKSIIRNKDISSQIFRSHIYSDTKIFDKMSRAIGSTITIKQKKKIKVRIAGLITVIAGLMNFKLTSPQIQHIFHQAYQKFDPEHLEDPDLPDTPEAFARSVKRSENFWIEAFQSDKK